jgi:hypothetical protein
MFGLFGTKSIQDPVLGTLSRSGGRWRGTISFGTHRDVPLRLAGGRAGPDAASLALAHRLPAEFALLRPQIETSLHEHYEPYRDAESDDGGPGRTRAFPRLERAAEVWSHVSPVSVLVEPLRGAPAPGPVVEIAYAVAWDEEHTVAARIQGGRVFELCGSVPG